MMQETSRGVRAVTLTPSKPTSKKSSYEGSVSASWATRGSAVTGVSLPPGWTLVGLPHTITTKFRNLAKEVIQQRFVPCVWLKMFNRKRIRRMRSELGLSKGRPAKTEEESSVVISAFQVTSEFTHSWPVELIQEISKKAVCKFYDFGEVVLHQGETSAVGVVLLLKGSCSTYKKDEILNFSPQQRNSQRFKKYRTEDFGAGDAGDVQHQLVAGGPQRFRHGPRKTKGLTCCKTTTERVVTAPHVFNDFAVFNEEPSLEYFVCNTEVRIAFIGRKAFLEAYRQLPIVAAQQLAALAHQKRVLNMPLAFPMTPGRLRVSPLLSDIPPEYVNYILAKMEPKLYTKGKVLCDEGRFARHVVFIRRGLAAYLDPVMGKRVMLRDGACLGEREVMFQERHTRTVVAISNVDAYVLSATSIKELSNEHPAVGEMLMTRGNSLRQSQLSWNLQFSSTSKEGNDSPSRLHKDGAVNDASNGVQGKGTQLEGTLLERATNSIPILNLFSANVNSSDPSKPVPPGYIHPCIKELRTMLKPCVFNVKQIVVSSADQCDRLLFATRGVAKVRENGILKPLYFAVGECIGYTCLVSHRWQHTIVVVEPMDCWELDRRSFVGLLQRHNLYHSVLGASLQLLQPLYKFPSSFPRTDQLSSVCNHFPSPNSFPHLHTPNMHPISLDDSVPRMLPWREESDMRGKKKVGEADLNPFSPVRHHDNELSGVADGSPVATKLSMDEKSSTAVLGSAHLYSSEGPLLETSDDPNQTVSDLTSMVTVDITGNMVNRDNVNFLADEDRRKERELDAPRDLPAATACTSQSRLHAASRATAIKPTSPEENHEDDDDSVCSDMGKMIEHEGELVMKEYQNEQRKAEVVLTLSSTTSPHRHKLSNSGERGCVIHHGSSYGNLRSAHPDDGGSESVGLEDDNTEGSEIKMRVGVAIAKHENVKRQTNREVATSEQGRKGRQQRRNQAAPAVEHAALPPPLAAVSRLTRVSVALTPRPTTKGHQSPTTSSTTKLSKASFTPVRAAFSNSRTEGPLSSLLQKSKLVSSYRGPGISAPNFIISEWKKKQQRDSEYKQRRQLEIEQQQRDGSSYTPYEDLSSYSRLSSAYSQSQSRQDRHSPSVSAGGHSSSRPQSARVRGEPLPKGAPRPPIRPASARERKPSLKNHEH